MGMITYNDTGQVRIKHSFVFVIPLMYLCEVLLEVVHDGFEFHRPVTIRSDAGKD